MTRKSQVTSALISLLLPPAATAVAGTNELPEGLKPVLERALLEDQYRISARIGPAASEEPAPVHAAPAYEAGNRVQGLRFAFSLDGLGVTPSAEGSPAWRWGLVLRRWGYGESLSPVAAPELAVSKNRIEYRRGALTEWYVNEPRGLEQGFTLAVPPAESSGGIPLRLELALRGDLRPELERKSQGIAFAAADGEIVLRYSKLYAYDAEGRSLPADLELQSDEGEGVGSVQIVVDDSSALYPVTIDPLLYTPLVELRASDAESGARFGSSVAAYVDTLVIGAPWDGHDGVTEHGGAVYVFKHNGSTWGQQGKVTAPEQGFEQVPFFGGSVAVYADTVVVGASTEYGGERKGGAYVYRLKYFWGMPFWSLEQDLTPSDVQANDRFGHSVAISGDTVLVGAPQDDDAGVHSGSAYVFRRYYLFGNYLWLQQAKLTAGDAAPEDHFGRSVALSGSTAVVGSSSAEIGYLLDEDASGSAYVFVKGSSSGWYQQAKLTASDAAAGDYFGFAVAAQKDTVVVGAVRADSPAGPSSGSAYVFQRYFNFLFGTYWVEQAKLTPSDAEAGDFFGHSVDLSNGKAVVGALSDEAGCAYVFVRNATGWTEEAKLTPPDGGIASESFGQSVAISACRVAIGSPNHSHEFAQDGAVYVTELLCPGESVSLGLQEGGVIWESSPLEPAGSVLAAEAPVEKPSLRLPAGDSRPAVCDLDGDGHPELVIGQGPDSFEPGWLEIRDREGSLLRGLEVGAPPGESAYGWRYDGSFPACGDLDGDGRHEIAVGLGNGGRGWVRIFDDASTSYRPLPGTPNADGWLRLGREAEAYWRDPWAGGEVRPAIGNLDGDAAEELALGLGAYPEDGGWVALLDDAINGFGPLPASPGGDGWLRVRWEEYNRLNGESWPAVCDLNGDGWGELVLGLGEESEGWVALLDSASGFAPLARTPELEGWVQMDGGDGVLRGESRPACGDLDGDGYDELVLGPGAGGGRVEVKEDLHGGLRHLRWLEVPAGGIRPAVGR